MSFLLVCTPETSLPEAKGKVITRRSTKAFHQGFTSRVALARAPCIIQLGGANAALP